MMSNCGSKDIKICRGSKHIVNVPRSADAATVKALALEKHANMDQYFCAYDDYILLYPDSKIVDTLLGSHVKFTVEGYKEILGKPFQKVDLYLCLEAAFVDSVGKSLEKPDDFDYDIKDLDQYLLHDTQNPHVPYDETMNVAIKKDVLVKTDVIEISDNDDNRQSSVKVEKSNEKNPFVAVGDGPSVPGPSKVICPICNMNFKVDEIENHADNCAIQRYSQHIHLDDDNMPQVELYDPVSSNDENKEEMDVNDLSSIRTKVKEESAKFQVYGGDFVQLLVFRGSCFLDFHMFFKKPWNAKKFGKRYIVKFAGEDGIDDGGVSREFYSGIYNIVFAAYI